MSIKFSRLDKWTRQRSLIIRHRLIPAIACSRETLTEETNLLDHFKAVESCFFLGFFLGAKSLIFSGLYPKYPKSLYRTSIRNNLILYTMVFFLRL